MPVYSAAPGSHPAALRPAPATAAPHTRPLWAPAPLRGARDPSLKLWSYRQPPHSGCAGARALPPASAQHCWRPRAAPLQAGPHTLDLARSPAPHRCRRGRHPARERTLPPGFLPPRRPRSPGRRRTTASRSPRRARVSSWRAGGPQAGWVGTVQPPPAARQVLRRAGCCAGGPAAAAAAVPGAAPAAEAPRMRLCEATTHASLAELSPAGC